MVEKSRLDGELWPSEREIIREFRWGRVYQLIYSGHPSLMVVENGRFYGTLYEYSTVAEFKVDRIKVLDFGDGLAGAAVPAPDRPNPPTLKDALRFPSLAPAE